MELLERKEFLDELARVLNSVTTGCGRTVLITGEAGIGKTALIEQFVEEHGEEAHVLLGACDALFTPRPLGPLYDIAYQLKGALLSLLEEGADRLQVFSEFLTELQENSPAIVVFEDIHWADEATLDLIKFTGRRIAKTDAMLILSYRDDEVSRSHPLRIVLGDLPSTALTRIVLPRLSEAAVADLAGKKQKSSGSLFAITAGNPFFVTEALAAEEPGVPTTVADAVLARAARLSPLSRELLELISCIPGRCERWLLEAVNMYMSESLDECIDMGLLRADDKTVFFRHELARLAIEDALPTGRYYSLHGQILKALQEHKPRVAAARLVHHASSAGDSEAVLMFAPVAAEQAASLRAHREAASHYAAALRYADTLSPEEMALLLERRSYECYLTEQLDEALQAQQSALSVWQELKHQHKVGNSYRWLSRLSWFLGRKTDAEDFATKALGILEELPSSREKAMAYSNMAQLHMLATETEEAVQWGEKAIEMAESLGEMDILAHALNNVGSAWFIASDIRRGEPILQRSLQLALENRFEEHTARAYTNLSTSSVINRKFEHAADYLKDGIAYCMERDLDSWTLYMQAWLAQLHFEQGNWGEAADVAQSVLKMPRLSAITKIPALAALGWVRVRRGDPEALAVLEEAKELALVTQELQRIAPVSAARAEAAWLNGNTEQCQKEVQPAYELALQHKDSWALGVLALWMWRAGCLSDAPKEAASPYVKQIAGDWRAAASLWEKIGCPYDQAMALADGNKNAQLQALKILRELGANPAAEIIERKLRARGVRSIPRGPRKSTQKNPAGLTTREMQVIPLLAEGLQNKEIADRLHISPKTVDHHISSILLKLNVHSRTQAVAAVIELGIISTK